MRLERQREQELEERRGLAVRTIIMVAWLVISAIVAYFVLDFLYATEIVSPAFFYNRLQIPGSVSETVLNGAIILILVIIMQFFLLVGFLVAAPLGRARTGRPTLRSPKRDPLGDDYRN